MSQFTPIAGIDSNDRLHPILVDASGRPLMVASGLYNGATQTAFKVDSAGRLYIVPAGDDNLLGIKQTFAESLSNTDLAAGTNYLNAAAIPAHTYLVVTAVTVMYNGTVTGVVVAVNGTINSANVNLWIQSPVVSGTYYSHDANWYFDSADSLQCAVTGATLHDDLYFRYAGYYMSAP